MTLFLTYHAKNNLLTQRKKVVPSLPQDHHVSAFRQVEVNPLLFEFHQTARLHFARRGCVLAEWLAYALHHVPQIGKVYVVFALVDFDDIALMQGRKMIRLLAIAGCNEPR